MTKQKFWLLSLYIAISPAWSQSWCQVDYYIPENIYRFAQHLFDEGDYIRAAGEFQRYLFAIDSSAHYDSVLLKIGLCYQSGHQPQQALRYYQKIIDNCINNNFADRAHYQGAYTFFETGDYKKSIDYILNNSSMLSTELARLKMNQLLGINYLYQRRWQVALDHFAALIQNQVGSDIDPFTGELSSYAMQGTKLPRKNAWLAGLMSTIIPGSGKMYTGRFADGFYSLILVGITGWQAYEGFHKDGSRSLKGWIYGSIGTIFYLGNIYGSVVAVKLHNEWIEDNFIQKINIQLSWR